MISEEAKTKYNAEFQSAKEAIENLSFKDIYESETAYRFKKRGSTWQAPCDHCGSGTGGGPNSDGAYTWYRKTNAGYCYSCGAKDNIITLIYHCHNFDYKQTIHYLAKEYLNRILVDPATVETHGRASKNIANTIANAKPKAKKQISQRKKVSDEELQAEEAEKKRRFDVALKYVLETTDITKAREYLEGRAIKTEALPSDAFYQSNHYYKDGARIPESVVFIDSQQQLLNKRYVSDELPAGVKKSFSFGKLTNSVYDITFRKEVPELYITEGVINALSLFQCGCSAIAAFATTNNITDKEKFAPYFEEKNIILAFDSDKAGLQAAIKRAVFILNNFQHKSLGVLLFPEKQDANNLLQNGELHLHIQNVFNYTRIDKKRAIAELQKIQADPKNYIPNLKPNSYFVRVADQSETNEGVFPDVEKEIPAEVLQRIGIAQPKTYEKYGLQYCSKYKIIKNKKAYIYQSTHENPVFFLNFDKYQLAWRPFDTDREIIWYGKTPKHPVIGNKQVLKAASDAKAATEAVEEYDDDDDEVRKKKRKSNKPLNSVVLVYSIPDLLNLTAIGEHPYFLEGSFLPYDLFKDMHDSAEKHYQVPHLSKHARAKAKKIALNHLDIRTLHLPFDKPYRTLSEYLINETPKKYQRLKNTALPYRFWEFKKGNCEIRLIRIRQFLQAYGYHTYQHLTNKQGYIYIVITGRTVRRIDIELFSKEARDFLESYFVKHGETEDVREAVAKATELNESGLSGLRKAKLDFDNFGTKYQQWFFSDGFAWTVTPNGIKRHRQTENNKYVWEHQILDYPSEVRKPAFQIFMQPAYQELLKQIKAAREGTDEFTGLHKKLKEVREIDKYDIEIHDRGFKYLQFLWLTGFVYWEEVEKKQRIEPNKYWDGLEEVLTTDQINEMKLHLINKISWYGYYMDDYRTFAQDYGWGILDSVDPDQKDKKKGSAGGGKTIMHRAISEVKSTVTIDASYEDFPDYKHRYEDYDGERVIVCDDMHEKSKIGNMLNDFSLGITVNPKHKKSIPIPMPKAPKIIVTRNYIDDEGERVDRRLGRSFVFNYFHDNKSGRYKTKRTPATVFKKMFFQNETDEEKSRLINFFAQCYIANKEFGEIQAPIDNVLRYRLTKKIGATLIDFWDEYFDNGDNYGYIERVPVYEEFRQSDDSARRGYYTKQRFKDLTEDYCMLKNLVFNPEVLINDKKNNRIKQQSKEKIGKNGYPVKVEFFNINTKDGFKKAIEELEQEGKIHTPEPVQPKLPM